MNIFIVLMVIYIAAMLLLGYLGSKRARTPPATQRPTVTSACSMFQLPLRQRLPVREPSWVSPARALPMA